MQTAIIHQYQSHPLEYYVIRTVCFNELQNTWKINTKTSIQLPQMRLSHELFGPDVVARNCTSTEFITLSVYSLIMCSRMYALHIYGQFRAQLAPVFKCNYGFYRYSCVFLGSLQFFLESFVWFGTHDHSLNSHHSHSHTPLSIFTRAQETQGKIMHATH